MRVVEKVFASLVLLRDKTLRVWEVRWVGRKDVVWICYEMRWGLVCWISGWAASQRHWPGTKHMNVVLNLGMGCVRGAIDRDWEHQYLISAPILLTHSFPDPPVCHDTLAWVLGTGAFLPVSILWIFQMSLYTYPASRFSAIGSV